MFGEVLRSELAFLFAGDVDEDDRSRRLLRQRGECARDLDECRAARRVVERAVVDAIVAGGGESEVIEMRGDDDVLVALSFQSRDDVLAMRDAELRDRLNLRADVEWKRMHDSFLGVVQDLIQLAGEKF